MAHWFEACPWTLSYSPENFLCGIICYSLVFDSIES